MLEVENVILWSVVFISNRLTLVQLKNRRNFWV